MTSLESGAVPEDYYNYLESWYRVQVGYSFCLTSNTVFGFKWLKFRCVAEGSDIRFRVRVRSSCLEFEQRFRFHRCVRQHLHTCGCPSESPCFDADPGHLCGGDLNDRGVEEYRLAQQDKLECSKFSNDCDICQALGQCGKFQWVNGKNNF